MKGIKFVKMAMVKNMNEENLITYYNKFNEDKRLKTKHARVEFLTAMKYIHEALDRFNDPRLLDVGAGTGAYSRPLYQEGYQVTAVELIRHNLRTMQMNEPGLDAREGNALDLSMFADESFDVVLLFGPLYHLISKEEKLKALAEAKRVLKAGGQIMISYCMNEYAIITHGVKEGFLKESVLKHQVSDDFHVISQPDDLYSFVRLEDIRELSDKAGLKRVKMIAQDGFAEYLKKEINAMDEETFELFLQYHLKNCERPEWLGFSRHVLDILTKED